jgi:mono/diheme cytochrome c family protein
VLEQPTKVRFHLGSDDGSRLLVDGKKVVDVDGVHPHQTKSEEIQLAPGPHLVVVEYFQGGGEWTVDLQWESPLFVKQPIDGWLQLGPDQPRKTANEEESNPAWIAEGKALFQSVGCVQCHAMKDTDKAASALAKAPSIDALKTDAGCLASQLPSGLPNYRLTALQKEAIVAALAVDPQGEISAEAHSKHTLAKLNCIACHQRNDWGGPESDKLDRFTSTIPEMGDEGRLPPRLTGVGDKLTDDYLNRVLSEGARHPRARRALEAGRSTRTRLRGPSSRRSGNPNARLWKTLGRKQRTLLRTVPYLRQPTRHGNPSHQYAHDDRATSPRVVPKVHARTDQVPAGNSDARKLSRRDKRPEVGL